MNLIFKVYTVLFTLSFRLSVIPLIEHIKIVATANPFNRDDDKYFTKRYITLKFSYYYLSRVPLKWQIRFLGEGEIVKFLSYPTK
jgi:hypothetical protein